MRDSEFNVGCVIVLFFVIVILVVFWQLSIQSDARPERAWQLYQESKIDEAAQIAKQKLTSRKAR